MAFRKFLWLTKVSRQPVRSFRHAFLGASWWSN